MARKRIKDLESELLIASQKIDAAAQIERSWRQRANENEAALKETRSHFADLKERLSVAETEAARLRGYLARVHEDDVVRDGLVEIEDANGRRHVPRRPPPLETAPSYSTPFDELDLNIYGGERRKKTHWTSY